LCAPVLQAVLNLELAESIVTDKLLLFSPFSSSCPLVRVLSLAGDYGECVIPALAANFRAGSKPLQAFDVEMEKHKLAHTPSSSSSSASSQALTHST